MRARLDRKHRTSREGRLAWSNVRGYEEGCDFEGEGDDENEDERDEI